MNISRFIILVLLLGAAMASAQAQETAPPTNTVAAVHKPVLAKKGDAYHLDTSFGYRRSLNGDYNWLMPAMIAFGKMMDDHIALDAVFGGGIIQLKHGSAADGQTHQPLFLELGIALRYYFAAREAPVKPYVTAGASLVWMSWEYRSPVDSPRFGFITRDYLEGADGYVGVGLSLRLRKHLNLFGEIDAGGIGFLPTTYSGVHNNLFRDFGYVGARGGLSLTF
jgi:outer membrane protein W